MGGNQYIYRTDGGKRANTMNDDMIAAILDAKEESARGERSEKDKLIYQESRRKSDAGSKKAI